MNPWREPAEESTDLYPGLVVHDGRVSGSITFGQSRLPAWAITGELFHGEGWEGVLGGWADEGEDHLHGVTLEDFSGFIYNLLEMRGEFGRLILMLANAERVEGERDDEHFAQQTPADGDDEVAIFDMSGGLPVAVFQGPDAWWQMPDITEPLREQLQRCLDSLPAPRSSKE